MSEVNSRRSDALPPQTLANGDCALFVWRAEADRQFILFSQSQKFTAKYKQDGKDTLLKIMDQDGIPTQNQFPVLRFDTGLELSLRNPEVITNGTRYKAGTLSSKTAAGWESVVPVIGLSTCA